MDLKFIVTESLRDLCLSKDFEWDDDYQECASILIDFLTDLLADLRSDSSLECAGDDKRCQMMKIYLPDLGDVKNDELLDFIQNLRALVIFQLRDEHERQWMERERNYSIQPKSSTSATVTENIDADLKSRIVQKHSMRPVYENPSKPKLILKPTEEKSKTRYLDSKVVSTKGERKILIKSEESDDMKKSYVNLKPLRKYRFH